MTSVVALGDVLSAIIDHRGKTPAKLGGQFVDSGVKVVSAIHIKNGRIDWAQRVRFVSDEMFRRWMPVRLAKNDVLLTSEAPLGEVALVPDDRDLVLSQRLFALRGRPDVLHSPYLYYYFQTQVGQDALHGRASGTTVVGIRQSELVRIPVKLPPLDEQKQISEVLGSIDTLIDINERLQADLLEIGLSSFSSWTSKAHGTLPLSEVVASAARGAAPKYSSDPDAVPVLNQKCIRDFVVSLDAAKYMHARKPRPGRFAEPGDVLVNSTGTGTLGRASRWIGLEPIDVDSHVTVVKPGVNLEGGFVAYAVLSLVSEIQALAEGSTGQTELSTGRLLGLRIPDLPANERQEISRVMDVIDESRRALAEETEQLRRTRNELLPLLMSGRIRVRDLDTIDVRGIDERYPN